MPELPDVEAYVAALRSRIVGETLRQIRLESIFFLRTVTPPLTAFDGLRVREVRRLGKRVVLGFDGELWLVIHLMIAGRLHWVAPGAKLVKRRTLAAFDFETGSVTVTEAGSKRRASLHAVQGAAALDALDPGGLEVLTAGLAEFCERLTGVNRTLKRALTDPRVLSGVGNAYSDEILHAARLSPIQLTAKMSDEQWGRLYVETQRVLVLWRDRFLAEAEGEFPERVTAFREDMAVHGRYLKPCPVCATAIQRIRYADNETNYCPECQTAGKLLADRSLSRLLRGDWPKTMDELETLKKPGR